MYSPYNLRHRNEAVLNIARAMQLPFDGLPDFPPRHRIGNKKLLPDPATEQQWTPGVVVNRPFLRAGLLSDTLE